jgi:hypothetical protein
MAGGALVARMPVLLLLAALALTAAPCAAYLPGVGPKEYNKGDSLPLYVNELTSTRTQYPIDYYSIPFCAPERGTIKMGKESLGGQLEGDLMESSLYELLVGFGSTCKILCEKELSSSDAWHFRNAIDQEYLVHMTADSLPIASNIKVGGTKLITSDSHISLISAAVFRRGRGNSRVLPAGIPRGLRWLGWTALYQ